MTTLPGLEAITVARWVYETLTADPEFRDLAGGPERAAQRVVEGTYAGAEPWWVTFTVLDPIDVKGVGLQHLMSVVQFQVKVVAKSTSFTPTIDPYLRVHELLEGRTHQEPTAGGLILTAQRVSGIKYPERASGIEYRHLGGLYETETQ